LEHRYRKINIKKLKPKNNNIFQLAAFTFINLKKTWMKELLFKEPALVDR
jgi:hypothetical protein